MGYPFSHSRAGDCGHRISATYYHDRAAVGRVGRRLCDTDSALIERRLFENTHRSIPDDRPGVLHPPREVTDSFDSDVHSGVTGVGEFNRNCLRRHGPALDRFVTVDDLM